MGVKRRECVGGPPAAVLSPRAERDSEEFRFSFSSCGPRMLGSCGVCGAEPAAFTDTDLHISPGRGAGHRVHLTRRLTSCGWQARYSLHAWHADNQSRRCGDTGQSMDSS